MTTPIDTLQGLKTYQPQFGRPGTEFLYRTEYDRSLTAETTVMVHPDALIGLPLKFDSRATSSFAPQQRPFDQGVKSAIASAFRQHGFRGAPIEVRVDHNGLPQILEGEVRVFAAAAAGLQQIPVHIEYYGHSEQLHTAWVPKRAERRTDLVWDPLQYTTMAWYAADTISPVATGTSIPQWNDLCPNHRHLTQATPSKQPTYIANAKNGLAALQFDGVTQLLATAQFSIAPLSVILTQFTVFSVMKMDALLTGNPGPWSLADQNLFSFFAGTNGSGTWAAFSGAQLNGRPYDTNWHIHTVIYNGANSAMRTDGVQLTGDVGVGGMNIEQIVLGAFDTIGSHIIQCKIGEWFAAPGVVDPVTLSRAEHYLSQRWGIANL